MSSHRGSRAAEWTGEYYGRVSHLATRLRRGQYVLDAHARASTCRATTPLNGIIGSPWKHQHLAVADLMRPEDDVSQSLLFLPRRCGPLRD